MLIFFTIWPDYDVIAVNLIPRVLSWEGVSNCTPKIAQRTLRQQRRFVVFLSGDFGASRAPSTNLVSDSFAYLSQIILWKKLKTISFWVHHQDTCVFPYHYFQQIKCVIPENIYTPHGGQKKFQGEGLQKEAFSEGVGVASRELLPGAPSKIDELWKLTAALLNKLFYC